MDDVIPVDSFSADTDQIRAVSKRNLNGNDSKSWQGDCFKLLHLIVNELPFKDIKTFIYLANAQTLIKPKSLNNKLEYSQDLYKKYNVSKLKKPLEILNLLLNFTISNLDGISRKNRSY